MTIRDVLHRAVCAALLAAAPGAAFAQAPAAPAARAAPAQDADLQAAIAKSNAYTALMNRTLRAIQSWERYDSWVDLKKGPTGKERYIGYGLYSLYDVVGEIRKAEEALAREPMLPEPLQPGQLLLFCRRLQPAPQAPRLPSISISSA